MSANKPAHRVGRHSLLTPALFLASLLLAAAALISLRRYPDLVWDGFVLSIAAMVAFALVVRRISADDASPEDRHEPSIPNIVWQAIIDHPWRGAAMLLALGLVLYLLRELPRRPPTATYTAMIWAWVFAFICYVLAVAPPNPRPRQDWSIWWEINREKVFALGGIVLLALFLRVVQIGSVPFTVSGDEASQGLEVMRVIEGTIRNPFSTGWLSVPTMSFFFNSITLRLFGQTATALRLPWALVGTATVLLTFWLVSRLRGVHIGFTAAALLGVFHYHIHFSRLGSNQIADPFFAALALLFLYRALDRQSPLDWTLLGASAGFSLYFYAGARFVPVLVIVILLYLLVCEGRSFWYQHRSGILIALGGFLFVAAPMIQYALRFPDDFNARINQVAILQSGWLAREVELRGDGVVSILFDQFRRAALAFNYYPDRTVWYGLQQPLLDPIFGGIFLLGLGYGTLRALVYRPDRRLAPFVFWWWGGMITGGMLTESPPSSQRLITLAVPVCFFIALGIWRLIQLADDVFERRTLPTYWMLGIGVILFGIISLNTYFVDFTPKRLYGGTNAQFATAIAPILNERTDTHDIYFVGPPYMYWGFATLPFLVPDADAQDVVDPITQPPAQDMVPPDRGVVFIFHPARSNELRFVRDAFPNGEVRTIRSPADETVIGVLYIVPPQH